MLISFVPFAIFFVGAGMLVAREYWVKLGEEEAEQMELMTWANNRPDIRNVSCVWTVGDDAGLPAFA
jgi:hypothetical protein